MSGVLGAALLMAAAVVLAGSAAVAAPTCWNGAGETVRCGAPGALPVGARLSAAQEAQRRSRPANVAPAVLIGAAALLGGLFTLLALLPDFERWER